jgi:lipoyl synthase
MTNTRLNPFSSNPGSPDPGDKVWGNEFAALLDEAWEVSRERHGRILSVHTPGMFVVNGRRGRYRAVSITGDKCSLDCDHCKGTLLRTMPHALDPQGLLRFGLEAEARGDHGILVTGGCDDEGRLPWKEFLPAIRSLKKSTTLTITVHAGQVDPDTSRSLKEAGVDQALVDVIGDEDTAREVYHLPGGTATIRKTLDSLAAAEIEIVPHILFGIHYGVQKGETAALGMLRDYPLRTYVVVVLMPARGTPMAATEPPAPELVAAFMAEARLALPDIRACLGCARPRGQYRKRLDVLAIRAGINALALPSDCGLEEAHAAGLEVVHSETCCSLT